MDIKSRSGKIDIIKDENGKSLVIVNEILYYNSIDVDNTTDGQFPKCMLKYM